LQDDAAGFADACRRVLQHDCADRDRKLRPLLQANHWDTIASSMWELIDGASQTLATAGQTA
jgi:hypothetical protein